MPDRAPTGGVSAWGASEASPQARGVTMPVTMAPPPRPARTAGRPSCRSGASATAPIPARPRPTAPARPRRPRRRRHRRRAAGCGRRASTSAPTARRATSASSAARTATASAPGSGSAGSAHTAASRSRWVSSSTTPGSSPPRPDLALRHPPPAPSPTARGLRGVAGQRRRQPPTRRRRHVPSPAPAPQKGSVFNRRKGVSFRPSLTPHPDFRKQREFFTVGSGQGRRLGR